MVEINVLSLGTPKTNPLALEGKGVVIYDTQTGIPDTFDASELGKAVTSVTVVEHEIDAILEYERNKPFKQPQTLFGAGTPQESIVPTNWKQYDPLTDEGFMWAGLPQYLGQQYVNTSASSGGLYIAVRDGFDGLKWQNV